MKNLLLLLGLCLTLHFGAWAQGPCSQINPTYQTQVFAGSQIFSLKDIAYSDGPDAKQRQKLDLYFPPTALSQNCPNHPLVMLIHGGGFRGGDKWMLEKHAKILARHGYLVVVPNYRLNLCNTANIECEDCNEHQDCYDFSLGCSQCNVLSEMNGNVHIIDRSWYKASQDCLAALHYAYTFYTDIMKLHVTKSFVWGASAGAVTALHLTYASQSEVDNYDPAISAQLGPLDRYFHSGVNYSVNIHGCVAQSGALMEAGFINNNDQAHLLMFHGDCDKAVPYCRTYCTNPNVRNMYGSAYIANHITNNGITSLNRHLLAFINTNNGHELDVHIAIMYIWTIAHFSSIITGTVPANTDTTYDINSGTGSNMPACN